MITRRQLLKWFPGLAAAMAVSPASPAVADVGPSAGSAAYATEPAGLDQPASAVDMQFRTKAEAVVDCSWRRYREEDRRGYTPSPLERVLGDTSLAESRVGIVNWQLLDESEDPNLGHFIFPMSPFHIVADDGTQQFLLFSNTEVVANFRHRRYLERVHRAIFDRAVWAMDGGRVGSAVVEFDRAVTDEKVDRIVWLLGHYGVKTIIWGNELNDPGTPWRDDLPALFDVFTSAAAARKRHGLSDLELSLPGVAYYGQGEYIGEMLRAFRELQAKRFPRDPDNWPMQRVADHFYGPVDALLPRILRMRDVMSEERASGLKYDLTEVGNPTLDGGQPRASDEQLAEGYIPQVASLAIGSGKVDRFTYYSLLDVTNGHSVMRIADGSLVKKPSYQALVVMAKLLSRLKHTSVVDESDRAYVLGARSDGTDFQVIWSKPQDQELWVDLPRGKRAFNALGQEVSEDRPGQIALHPRQHHALAGPARIIIG